MKNVVAAVVFLTAITKVFGYQVNDPLLFPKDSYTTETKTIKTSTGEKKVVYRSYLHILYVTKPVDKDYQSLNVSVPIKIDDVDLDAANSPILFVVGVGAYMSVSNTHNGGGMGGPGGGMMAPPPGAGGMGGPPPGMNGPGNANRTSSNADLALAAGYVVVSPACRGRDNKAPDGTYFGKAPAAIVDLKAAVRYIRHNKSVIPGNTDWIFSTGVSAGGALSAFLGTSGNSPLYDPYLKEIGAADADDAVYGCAAFCPITDLEHADGAYEWMYGPVPTRSKTLVDQRLSRELKAIFRQYQASLHLQGKDGFGAITADNYDKYLLQYYLIPSANKFLGGLTTEKRNDYLTKNPWITWTADQATFTFTDYVTHVGRMKGLPAFDDFNQKSPEPNEFGDKTTDARHFTDFSLQHLADYINHIKAIDNHAHPNTLDPEDKGADALPLDGLGPIQLPVRVRPESPVWITAAKALYGFDGTALDQEATKSLITREQDTQKQKGADFPNWALDKAGIEVMLSNRIAMGPGLSSPHFRWVSFVDAFLFPLSTKTEAAATPDRQKLFPMEAQLLKNYLNDLHQNQLPATLDSYLKQVVTATLESQRKSGCLAVKFEAAYLRSLEFEKPPLQEAQSIYAQYINGSEPSQKDNKRLQDYIFRYIAREAGRLGMAVHIHSYPAAGDYFVAKDCDPLLLESVFNDPELRNTNFVILHGGESSGSIQAPCCGNPMSMRTFP
jgi:hypothetical protein